MNGRAHRSFLIFLVEADKALLFRLAVGVLEEDGEQFQGIPVRERSASLVFLDQIEFGPRPRFGRPSNLARRHLSLDHGRVDDALAGTDVLSTYGIRAPTANNPDGIHDVGAEAQRPQQARGGDLAVDFAIVLPKLDLDFLSGGEDARKLGGCPFETSLNEVACDGVARSRRTKRSRSALQILGADAWSGSRPARAQ